MKKLIFNFVKHNILKEIVFHVSITFTYVLLTTIVLSFGSLAYGGNKLINEGPKSYFENNSLIVEKQESLEFGNGSLKINKVSRPSINELNSIFKYGVSGEVSFNYSSVMGLGGYTIFGEKISGFETVFLNSVTFNDIKNNLISPVNLSINEKQGIYINNAMVKHIEKQFSLTTITELLIDYTFDYLLEGVDVYFGKSFRIKGIINEFDYLSSPKIYISHPMIQSLFSTISMSNNYTLLDYVLNLDDYHELTTHSYIVFFKEYQDVDAMERILTDIKGQNSKYVVTSSYKMTFTSFAALNDVLLIAAMFTIFIISIGVFFVIYSINNILIQKSEKSISVLMLLGVPTFKVKSLYYILNNITTVFVLVPFIYVNKLVNLLNKQVEQHAGISDLLMYPLSNNVIYPLIAAFVLIFVIVLINISILEFKVYQLTKDNVLKALGSND